MALKLKYGSIWAFFFDKPGVPGVLGILGRRYPFKLRRPGVVLIAFLMVYDSLMYRVWIHNKLFRHKNMEFYVYTIKGHPQIATAVVERFQDFPGPFVSDLAQPVKFIIRMVVDRVPFYPHNFGKSASKISVGVIVITNPFPQDIFPSRQV